MKKILLTVILSLGFIFKGYSQQATSTNQIIGNNYLNSINTLLGTGTINVTISGASGTFIDSTKFKLDTIGVSLSATPVSVYQWNVINSTTSSVIVRLYNKVNPVKTDIPIARLFVPASGTVVMGNDGDAKYSFSTALGARVSTGVADNDNGEPTKTSSNQVILQIKFK